MKGHETSLLAAKSSLEVETLCAVLHTILVKHRGIGRELGSWLLKLTGKIARRERSQGFSLLSAKFCRIYYHGRAGPLLKLPV